MTLTCIRCGQVAPEQESDAFLDWEAADEEADSVICPGCLTHAEMDTAVESFAAAGGDHLQPITPPPGEDLDAELRRLTGS